jgi:hypothetical protein
LPISLIDGPEEFYWATRARKDAVGGVCRGFTVIKITNAANFDTLHKQAADFCLLANGFDRCAKLIEAISAAAGILKLIEQTLHRNL